MADLPSDRSEKEVRSDALRSASFVSTFGVNLGAPTFERWDGDKLGGASTGAPPAGGSWWKLVEAGGSWSAPHSREMASSRSAVMYLSAPRVAVEEPAPVSLEQPGSSASIHVHTCRLDVDLDAPAGSKRELSDVAPIAARSSVSSSNSSIALRSSVDPQRLPLPPSPRGSGSGECCAGVWPAGAATDSAARELAADALVVTPRPLAALAAAQASPPFVASVLPSADDGCP